MALIEKIGDLFTSDADALGHGVNCKGLMGKGIARAFRERWPEMYEEYRLLCREGLLLPGQIFPYKPIVRRYSDDVGGKGIRIDSTVINIATQEYPGPDASYEWVDAGTRNALAYCQQRGLKELAIPRIGCGIGGLEWADVKDILEVSAQLYPDVELQVYTLA